MVHRYTHSNMLRVCLLNYYACVFTINIINKTLAGLTKILLDRFVDWDMSILLPGNYC